MIRRITQEERVPVWTQFACAALSGMLASPSFDNSTRKEICETATQYADEMMEWWDTMMEGALEMDEEDVQEQRVSEIRESIKNGPQFEPPK